MSDCCLTATLWRLCSWHEIPPQTSHPFCVFFRRHLTTISRLVLVQQNTEVVSKDRRCHVTWRTAAKLDLQDLALSSAKCTMSLLEAERTKNLSDKPQYPLSVLATSWQEMFQRLLTELKCLLSTVTATTLFKVCVRTIASTKPTIAFSSQQKLQSLNSR